jgi:A/G-specific adenine glycosylase
MLQQTQVSRVIPKYREFLEHFPTWKALAQAPVSEVIRAWASLGYNLRAVRLHRIAQQVLSLYGGVLPQDYDTLLQLEGLGPYTAAAVASFAFGQDVPVLDTNVKRVLRRLCFGQESPSQQALRERASLMVPPSRGPEWHQALMDIGATLCFPKAPVCQQCPLEQWCHAAQELRQPLRKAAEARPAYNAKATPFKGSTRYYRGRIVEALRGASNGQRLALAELGTRVKPGFRPEDTPWLLALLEGLQRDGLVKLHGTDEGTFSLRVSLP